MLELLPDSSDEMFEERRLLCLVPLLVRVPLRDSVSGGDEPSTTVSPTSLSCLVMDVRGNLGFMDGLRLMVPVVGKSHSNATSQHDGAPPSLIQPLELELEALLRDESLLRNRGPGSPSTVPWKLWLYVGVTAMAGCSWSWS